MSVDVRKMLINITHCASLCGTAIVVVGTTTVLAVGVLAGTADSIALDLNTEVELGIGGGRILKDREPCCAVAVSDTDVHWREVAPWVGISSPLAAVLDSDTGWVDVVLRRGAATLPLVVVVGIRASQVGGGTGHSVDRHGLALGTWIIGTADGHVLGQVVLDQNDNIVGSTHAELLGHVRVGEVELSTGALDASNRLASLSLGGWPLRLLVTWWAGVRAVVALGASIALDLGHDVLISSGVGTLAALDSSPAAETSPFNRNCAVLGWESAAAELTIGEISIDTSRVGTPRSRARARGVAWRRSGLGSRSSSLGGRWSWGLGSCDRSWLGAGGWCYVNGWSWSTGRGSRVGRWSRRGELAVTGKDKRAVLDALLDFILGNELAVQNVDDLGRAGDGGVVRDWVWHRVALRLVQVLVSMAVGLSSRNGDCCGEQRDGELHVGGIVRPAVCDAQR